MLKMIKLKYFLIGGMSLGVGLFIFWLCMEIPFKDTSIYNIVDPFLQLFDRYVYCAIAKYLNDWGFISMHDGVTPLIITFVILLITGSIIGFLCFGLYSLIYRKKNIK